MDFATKLAFIAAGGALGAVSRYLINVSPLQHASARFPYPTFAINIIGSFLIGLCLILFTDRIDIGDNLRFGIMVGFVGAFTTFSTFELEIWGLVKENNYATALIYVLMSVGVGFAALLAGIWIGRKI